MITPFAFQFSIIWQLLHRPPRTVLSRTNPNPKEEKWGGGGGGCGGGGGVVGGAGDTDFYTRVFLK